MMLMLLMVFRMVTMIALKMVTMIVLTMVMLVLTSTIAQLSQAADCCLMERSVQNKHVVCNEDDDVDK
eukprot:4412699-Ditylum_brightwellii.AAC.1